MYIYIYIYTYKGAGEEFRDAATNLRLDPCLCCHAEGLGNRTAARTTTRVLPECSRPTDCFPIHVLHYIMFI